MQDQYTLKLNATGGKVIEAQLAGIGAAGTAAFGAVGAGAARAGQMMTALGPVFARALPALSIVAIARGFKEITSELSELNDEANKLGLSTDRLQELRWAAIETGNAAADMDAALSTFTAKIGEAQLGMGKLVPVLKAYGIELREKDGSQRKINDILREYVALIASVGSAEEKLVLARKGFGEQGDQLLEVFAKGPEFLDQMARAAQESGYVIDKDLIQKADQFNDAWEKATALAEAQLKGRIYDAVVSTVEAVDDMKYALIGMLEVMQRLAEVEPWWSRPLAGGLQGYLQDLREAVQRGQAAARQQREIMNAPSDGLLDYDPEFGAGDHPLVPPVIKTNADTEGERKHADAIRDTIEALKFKNAQLQRSAEDQAIYNELARAGVTLDSAAGQEIAKQVKEMQRLTEARNEEIEATKEQERAARELGLAFTSAFEDAIVEGRSLGDVLKGLEQDILRIMTRKMVTEPMANFFTGIFKDFNLFDLFKTSVAHTGGIGRESFPMRSVPAAAFAGAPRFHGGKLPGIGAGEMAAIIRRDEGVFTPEQMRALGSPQVTVNFQLVNETGVSLQQPQERKGAGGMTEIVLRRQIAGMMSDAIGDGSLDRVMGARYGVRRQN